MIYRSFIAIEVPSIIQTAIFRLTENLRQQYPPPCIRWVPVNNIHLTLLFLGEVSSQNLEILARSLALEIKPLEIFSIPFSETGVFPNVKRPRVIWIGLKYLPGFLELNKIIQTTSSSLGYSVDERPFSPHITLGRVGDNFPQGEIQKFIQEFIRVDTTTIEPIIINSIKVFKSELRPKSPEYTIIHSIPFAGKNF